MLAALASPMTQIQRRYAASSAYAGSWNQSAGQQVRAGQPAPRPVRRQQLAHLFLARARERDSRAHAADQLQVAEIAGGQLVEAALAVQGEHLDGPAADARDRAQ